MQMSQQTLMTASEVAGILNVSLCFVYRLKERPGGLPSYRVGNRLRFRSEDVDNYLKSHMVEPIQPSQRGYCRVRFRYVPGMKVV